MSEQTLKLQVVSESKSAVAALNNLASALGRIKNAVNSGMDFSKVSDGLGKLNAALSQTLPEENVAKLERIAAVVDKLSNAGNVKIKIDSGAQNALSMQPVQDALQNAKESAQVVSESQRELATATTEVDQAAKSAASGVDEYKQSVKEAGRAANNSKGFFSQLVSSIGRIAFYRAIRSAVKAVTDSFKEGVTNVRKYSEAIGGSFARDMNSASASLATMKNSLGAAVAPALQALIPILSAITSFAITAFNALNQLLSLLRGGGSWTRAKASMEGYTKAVKGAGGATKDLLADWDELNIIQSKSGGSGGPSDIDYSDMFEEVYEFDSRIKAIVTWLQEHMDLVKAAAWGLVGAFAAWKLTNGFKIDLLDVGKQIGRFLLLWLGVTIAIYGAKKAFDAFKDQFENGINWDNLKKAIGYSALAVLGLGIAFGRLGVGYGLLGVGIALIINPIKELVETGKMSEEAMTQLGAAVGAVAGGLTLLVTKDGLRAARMMLGLGIAAYGAAGAYQAFREQWENGIDYENSTELIRKLGIAVLGLGIAFGKFGLGFGLLAFGIALIVNPIKELIETGNLSNEAMFQLAAGLGAVAGGATLLITGDFIKSGRIMLGVAIAAYGAAKAYEAFKDQWENGIDYENSTELIRKLGLAVLGLGIAFGINGAGIGLLAGGITAVITPIKEMVQEISSGKDAITSLRDISDESFSQMETGILTFGLGLSLLTGSWIPVAITLFVDFILWVVREWDSIVDGWNDTWESLKDSANQALAGIIDFVTPFANWIIDKINLVLSGINKLLSSLGIDEIQLVPRIDAEQLKRDLHLVKETVVENLEGIVPNEELGKQMGFNYDSWKEALSAYEFFEPGYIKEDAFWDMAVKPLLDRVLENAGVAKEAGEKISSEFFKAWLDSDLMSDYDGEIEKLTNTLNDLIVSNGGFIEVKPQEIEQSTSAIDDIASSTDDFAKAMQEAISAVTEWQQEEFAKVNSVKEQTDELTEATEDYADAVQAIPSISAEPVQVPDVIEMPEEASFDYEVDTSDIDSLVDALHEEMTKIVDEGLDYGDASSIADKTIESLANAIGEAYGYSKDEIRELRHDLERAVLYLNEDVEGLNVDSVMEAIRNLLENPEGGFVIPGVDISEFALGLNNAVDSVTTAVANIKTQLASLNGIGFSFGWSGFGGRIGTVGVAAGGGMFDVGEMFIAREKGPELVGRMGRRSTVANNDQIVSGIAMGVASANDEQNSLLRQQNALLTRLLGKKFTAEVHPSAALGRVTSQSQRMYERTTG